MREPFMIGVFVHRLRVFTTAEHVLA